MVGTVEIYSHSEMDFQGDFLKDLYILNCKSSKISWLAQKDPLIFIWAKY